MSSTVEDAALTDVLPVVPAAFAGAANAMVPMVANPRMAAAMLFRFCIRTPGTT
jgi:hypothetical protein